jgi:hypothetical protein
MPQRGPCDGRLTPWAGAVAGAAGWQITTRSRRAAVALAATMPGGTVHHHTKGQWQTRIPHTTITAVVTDASTSALWCRLNVQPGSRVFVLVFAPWPATAVLKCPPSALPAQGQLTVRDVRVTTRMGRTVRYLIPEFTTTT